VTAADWPAGLHAAGEELQDDLEALREVAAEAAMAQQVAERRGETALARACGQRLAVASRAVAALQRQAERLQAWRAQLLAAGEDAASGWRVTLIEAQEEERRRLARDIHDGPAQLLATVVFRIDVAEKLLGEQPERARTELEQLKALVRHSLQDVRKIIFDLRPLALDDLGFVPALRAYAEGLAERVGLRVTVRVAGRERRLPPPQEVALFRLVQEALHNVRKHAGTDTAAVEVNFEPQAVAVRVSDDGAGFEPQALAGAARERLGLRSMRERAELFGGTFAVQSAPGRGTVVTVTLPAAAPSDRAAAGSVATG
jgi:two-component system sensor histidine kinase DegS